MTATRSELQAWLDAYDTPDAPDAQTLADFLGIELAPEPATPCGAAAAVAEWRRGRQDGRLGGEPLAEVPGWQSQLVLVHRRRGRRLGGHHRLPGVRPRAPARGARAHHLQRMV